MDHTNVQPRYFVGHRQNNEALTSASSHTPVTVVLREQELLNEITAGHTASAIKLDFTVGALVYKKNRLRNDIFRGLKIATTLGMITVLGLGGFGYWLNHKYAGRALPFSHVGGILVGGLNRSQIKHALDERTKELKITLIDGGFSRTVPASMFGAKFDTETASKQIIPAFNPFAFLDRRSVDVPVTINDYQVDGYMRINVHPSQTKPSDATLTKDKNKLVVKPPVIGFQSDPKFVADSIRRGLVSLNDPLINLNAVTIKPKISEADLVDDAIKANQLLSTNVTITYGRSMNVITPAQKLAWMQFTSTDTSKDIQINFSRSLIRQFVVDLAKKYQAPTPVLPEVASPEASTEPVAVTPVDAIDNIEQVTDAVVAGLSSGQATSTQFAASKSQHPAPVSVTPESNIVANR